MKRDVELDLFPPGTRVMTPTGRTGTVIKHKGFESKHDHFLRVTVQIDGGSRHDLVTLQPHLLTKCPPTHGSDKTIDATASIKELQQ